MLNRANEKTHRKLPSSPEVLTAEETFGLSLLECHSYPMKIILTLLLFVLGSLTGNACESWQKEWLACNADADCIAVKHPCAKPAEKAVNKKYEDLANRVLSCSNATKNCLEPCAVLANGKCKQPETKCKDSACSIVL